MPYVSPAGSHGVEGWIRILLLNRKLHTKSLILDFNETLEGVNSLRHSSMTEDDIIAFVTSLPGVVAVTAGEANGAPEVAWGDSFFFYDPDGKPSARRMPFATIVTKDYDGFDTASNLNRPGVFRLNIGV